jgi:hypothetical protein
LSALIASALLYLSGFALSIVAAANIVARFRKQPVGPWNDRLGNVASVFAGISCGFLILLAIYG